MCGHFVWQKMWYTLLWTWRVSSIFLYWRYCGLTFDRFDSQGRVSRNYLATVLFEIILAEGEKLLGCSYLIKKCYLAERVRHLDIFEFTKHSTRGVFSKIVSQEIAEAGFLAYIRMLREDEAACGSTKNYCGEMLQEHIALYDEQAVYFYVASVVDHPDFQEWQKAIAQINEHPSGKDWQVLSVATHLHGHLRSGNEMHQNTQMAFADSGCHIYGQTVIEKIKKCAAHHNVFLSDRIFADAFTFLDDLGL